MFPWNCTWYFNHFVKGTQRTSVCRQGSAVGTTLLSRPAACFQPASPAAGMGDEQACWFHRCRRRRSFFLNGILEGAHTPAPLIHCGIRVGPTSDSKVYKHTRNVSSIKNQSNRHQSACCIITECVGCSGRRDFHSLHLPVVLLCNF